MISATALRLKSIATLTITSIDMSKPVPSVKRIQKAGEFQLSPVQEYEIARAVWSRLYEYYPGHNWHVIVEQGLIRIRHMNLHADYGITMGLEELTPEGKELMRAGGEMLERFNLARTRAHMDKIKELPKDHTGGEVFHKD